MAEEQGGLDQNLSMKATMKDGVTPVLGRIERFLNDTREAFRNLVGKSTEAGETISDSTSRMTGRVTEDLQKVQSQLGQTGKGFVGLGERATQGSQQVGQALQDALYTKRANEKLGELDKDLGSLGDTFDGMAARQRTVSGSSKSLQSKTKDNINKKVIPAFQELHGTLDKYPDTLEEINQLEQDRTKYLTDQEGVLGRVSGRLDEAASRLGAAGESIKFGLQDVATAITGGALGATGLQVQDIQSQAARVTGIENFAMAPKYLEDATRTAKTTMSVLEPIYIQMLELRSVAGDAMDDVSRDIVNVSKATGFATDEVGMLYDKLVNVAGIRGEGFLEVYDNIKFFAEGSRASLEEINQVMQSATDEMLIFTGEARKAYTESTAAAAAAARNMNLDAGTPQQIMSQLLDSPEMLTALQGMATSVGIDANLRQLVSEGKTAEVMDVYAEVGRRRFEGLSTSDTMARYQIQGTGMGLYDADTVAKIRAGTLMAEERGLETSAVALQAQAGEGAAGKTMEAALAVRGTQVEEMEQAAAAAQNFMIEPGRQFMEMTARATDLVGRSVESFTENMGPATSNMIALGAATETAALGLKGIGKVLEEMGLETVGSAFDLGVVDKVIVGGAVAGYSTEDVQGKNLDLLGEDQGIDASRKHMIEGDTYQANTKIREAMQRTAENLKLDFTAEDYYGGLREAGGKVEQTAIDVENTAVAASEFGADSIEFVKEKSVELFRDVGTLSQEVSLAVEESWDAAKEKVGGWWDDLIVGLRDDVESVKKEAAEASAKAPAGNDKSKQEEIGIWERMAGALDKIVGNTDEKPQGTQPVVVTKPEGAKRAETFKRNAVGRTP